MFVVSMWMGCAWLVVWIGRLVDLREYWNCGDSYGWDRTVQDRTGSVGYGVV